MLRPLFTHANTPKFQECNFTCTSVHLLNTLHINCFVRSELEFIRTIVVADVTAVKRSQTDAKSGTAGNNLGIRICPAINLTIAIPAVIVTNTTAKAIDIADV
jgi:hypothetical protein